MKKILLMLAVVGLIAVPVVYAHDGALGTLENPYLLNGYDQSSGYIEIEHPDDAPWKGTFTLTVKNTSTQAWGDFHFGIWGAPGVYFGTDGGNYPKMNDVTLPASQFEIVGGNTQLNLFFYDTPVYSGETVKFEVYTDNTANQNVLFGIYFYPTPVPEPATLAILGLGGLALLRKRK